MSENKIKKVICCKCGASMRQQHKIHQLQSEYNKELYNDIIYECVVCKQEIIITISINKRKDENWNWFEFENVPWKKEKDKN